MKARISMTLGLGSAVLLGACGPEAGRTVSVRSEAELEQVVPTLLPGDVVEHEGAGITVPPPGEGVYVESIFEGGRTTSFSIETPSGVGGGRLVRPQVVHEDEHRVSASDVSALAACDEGAYTLLSYKWLSTYRWSFNAATTPSYLGAAAAEDHLVQSTANITTGRNNCGLTDAISASHNYLGRTSRGTQVSVSGTCGSRDGYSVTAFGDLPSGTLATTCTWYVGGEAVESDVIINKADHLWVTAISGCSGRYHLQAVMTHERGHTYGLGHVASGSLLTMRPSFGYCDASGATLGLGDVRGLRQKY